MDISKLVNLTLEQIVSIGAVLVLSLTMAMFKKIIKVNFFIALFPFTLCSVLLLAHSFLSYSIFPYLVFGYIWVGIGMFLYHYKKNYYFKVGQFLKKWMIAIAFCHFFVWIGVVAYTIIHVLTI